MAANLTAEQLHDLGQRVNDAELRACGGHGDVESAKLCRELWTILKLRFIYEQFPLVKFPSREPVSYTVFADPDGANEADVFGS